MPLADLGYREDHQAYAHQHDQHQEDRFCIERPLRTIGHVALTLTRRHLRVPVLLVLDETAGPVLEDALEVNGDGDQDDVHEANDGTIEVNHDIEMNVEHIGDVASKYYQADIEDLLPVYRTALFDLAHLEETEPADIISFTWRLVGS